MKPLLPQHDPKSSHREKQLDNSREVYRYDYTQFEELACSPDVPKADLPHPTWAGPVCETVLDSLQNMGLINNRLAEAERSFNGHHEVIKFLRTSMKGGLDAVYDRYKNIVIDSPVKNVHATSVSDYERLFEKVPLPEVASYWDDDRNFARMRVAGPNPMVMKGIDTVPDNFAVTEAHFQRAFQAHSKSGLNGAQADSLEAAVAEGRLFLCDYAALAGIPSGTYPHGRAKYVTPAMVLMATTPDTHRLLPVAIQCGQTPGDEAPVFTPGHRYWTLAKLAANVADGTHHQAVAHLAWTHLTIEPAVLAARRQLAPAHPIYRLLHCHQEGTLFINDAANTKLMAPDGGVDAVMVPEIHAARAATVAAVQSWDFTEMMFPAELESRGLMNSDVLPDHPYRDDGLLVWTALKEWATDFIAIYYRTDEDVLGDCELQAFFTELGSPDGGRISGIGMDGKISNLPALIDAVTQLMFTPSAQHAAVNFPQAELMTFVPNLPLSAYAPPPGAHETAAASDLLLRTLPPLDIAEYQQVLGHLLGVTRHGKLGHYPGHVLGGNFAHDPRVDAPLKALMSRLTTIEEQITGRNQERWKPYEYLLPSLIPQSINI